MIYLNIKIKKKFFKKILNIKNFKINNVGIKNIFYPIIFDNKKNLQKTISIWNISVFLRKHFRGIHMSRIINILNIINNKPINFKSLYIFNKFLIKYLKSNLNNIQLSFIYFVKKKSPITKNFSYLNYKLTLFYKMINIENLKFFKIKIPISTLCPCSKIISNYNSHNQRSFIYLLINIKKDFLLDNFIKLIENESSCQLWNILKRRDEKYVTEFSYNNPKFVEDLIRNLYSKILKFNFINSFIIKVENLESIHNYNAYGLIKF